MWQEIGLQGDEGITRRIVPDVVLEKPSQSQRSGNGVALLDRPRAVSASIRVTIPSEPVRHPFIEIRDPRDGHKLITLIEIVSFSNKRPGLDREAYLFKQAEVLGSDASLVEIDLLSSLGQGVTSYG